MPYTTARGFYERLPLFTKRLFCLLPFSVLAGKTYRQVVARGKAMDLASKEEIRAYQEKALGEILRFATDQVPAYRPYRSAVERFAPFDALQEFPFLTKDVLQAKMREYLPHDFANIPHYSCTTGGTSGTQLKFYLDDNSQSAEIAFMHRQWARMGYLPSCRKATFRGVNFAGLRSGVFWQSNPVYNELQFSPFHMSETNLPAYVQELGRYRPEFVHGYPSAIDILARHVLRYGLQDCLPRIKAVFLGSEGLLPGQRERIEAAFQSRTFSWYGHSERLVLAGECRYSSDYHHFPDYGILEIVDEKGNSCKEPGQRGEIVGTGLLNRSLPLIRYRTGDLATRKESACACRRNWERFADVEGRWEQAMLLGRTGARISIAALNMHGPLFVNVARYQYHQPKDGVCVLRLVVHPGFADTDGEAIRNAYAAKTGDEIEWRTEVVKDIPLTSRGKLRLLDAASKSDDSAH